MSYAQGATRNRDLRDGRVVKEFRQPYKHHQQNQSLAVSPSPSALTFADGRGPPSADALFRLTHRPTRSVPSAKQDPIRVHTPSEVNSAMNVGSFRETGGSTASNGRADLSQGSWLDDGSYSSHESTVEDGDPFDLEDYLVATAEDDESSRPSSTLDTPVSQKRVVVPPLTSKAMAQPEGFSNGQVDMDGPSKLPYIVNMASYKPTPIQTDAAELDQVARTRSRSESDALFDISPSHFARPQTSAPLPDPSNFPDPYPFGLSHHRPASGTPALSSAGSSSASTRSSAYTNPGSLISSNGASGDYGNVRVASGDDIAGDGIGIGITADTVVEFLSRTSDGSSLSSGSRKSRTSPMDRVRRADYMRSSRSPSQSSFSEEKPSAQFDVPPQRLRTQPSYDTSWQRGSADHEDIGMTSEEDFEYEHEVVEHNSLTTDEELPAAIAVAEEGRGLIIRGEGLPVTQLTVQPGITHLLIGGSSTPNTVPAFITMTIPQICGTLLALDISANYLACLSPALASCASLEELNISSNPLRALPVFLAELSSLRVLIADSTGISTVPEPLAALEKLHTLSVRRNKLHSLPSWLCTLPCLESLLVDGNPFQGPWRALIEPLLAKLPMTPSYPPSTPMFPQLSASGNSTNTTTTDTDNSDAEELTDHDDALITALNVAIPASAPLDSRFIANIDEELTITPASAHLLERSATSLANTQPIARPLSRTRTTPNRQFYEREQASRSPNLNKEAEMEPGMIASSSSTTLRHGQGELRRMRSADELRRALQAGAPPAFDPSSSSRPGLKHFATTAADSDLMSGREEINAASIQSRKFASLGVNSRGPSRAGSRPSLANNIWNEQGIDEDGDAEAEPISRPPSRARVVPMGSQRQRGEPSGSQGTILVKSKSAEKEKSSRKWGFLKKMSMGKMRDMEVPSSRPATSHGFNPSSAVPSTPRLEISSMSQGAASSSKFLPPITPSSSDMFSSKISPNAAADSLKIPSSSNLLAPPSPTPLSASAKRRSFLPLDGPPALNIPIPSTAPFLSGIMASNGMDEFEDGSKMASSPVAESMEEMQRREEERSREANARALRSVMAYLKDMNDLSTFSQGNVMSMYGSPPMDRSRRPTLSDVRLQSEVSIDSIDTSSSSVPTTVFSNMRSIDSRSANRSTSSNATMSIATTDSGGSGSEERKAKDDRQKRAMIIREIIETERTYVRTLQELVEIYVRPACAPVTTIGGVTVSSGKDQVIPITERKIVFGDVESLYTFHKSSFLPALEKAARPLLNPEGSATDAATEGKLSSDVAMAVGRTFSGHAAFMKMYSSYINNLENATQRIRHWVADRPAPSASSASSASITPSSSSAQLASAALALSAVSSPGLLPDGGLSSKAAVLSSGQRKRIKGFLKRCRANPRHSQLNLEVYLHLPVQRITRYPLLLDDLVRNTPRPADSFDDPIATALNEISSLATNMNEGKREAEGRRKLVQWQARIRGKFPSPLVQPHRRLIKDGKLLLTRIVRKQTMAFDVLDSHGDSSSVAVDCLAPELTPRPLYGILCNDLFVLCRDPSDGKDPASQVDLWAVLRLQTMPQPTSIVHGNALRIVDTKAILYLEAPSTSEALTWFRAINLHVPIPSPRP